MKQTDRPVLNIYIAAVPAKAEPRPVYPPERADWIASASDALSRRERYAVWRLLERGVRHSFGWAMEDLRFTETDGKWGCDRLEFSLSHSGDLVAAAVSDAPVGVDVESLAAFAARGWDGDRVMRIARRVCAPEELRGLKGGEDFLRLWTKKESIFKRVGGDGLLSGRIAADAHETATFRLSRPAPCILSVCADAPERARLFLAEGTGLRPYAPEPAEEPPLL